MIDRVEGGISGATRGKSRWQKDGSDSLAIQDMQVDDILHLAAAALEYTPYGGNSASAAPVLSAKGRGQTARRIIEKAMEAGIPIYRDQDLVTLLMKIELESRVPAELFEVVAEVFAYVYQVNGDFRKKLDGGDGS